MSSPVVRSAASIEASSRQAGTEQLSRGRRVLTVCSVPGCPNLAPRGQRGRCDEHAVLAKGSQAWRRLSAQVIAEEHGICHWCHGSAVTADHLVPISLGGTDD